ncbi:MAG: 50S ribosomal protein L10 [Patescibacteria group bacterium]
MARTKEQKKEIIAKVKSIIDGASSLVFVNMHKLTVADSMSMRRALKADNVGFFVAKKTLTSLALADKKYAGQQPELVGEFGLAYGSDLVAPARGIYEFQKKFKDRLSIVGGVFENKFMNKEEMISIASIPPQHTLHGMFVNVINSPIQRLVIALDQIAQKKA